MRRAEDPEDLGVAGQRNLDEDVTASRLSQQLAGVRLAHDVDALPDALGARDLDGLLRRCAPSLNPSTTPNATLIAMKPAVDRAASRVEITAATVASIDGSDVLEVFATNGAARTVWAVLALILLVLAVVGPCESG
jgi:hypothetical protein